MINSAREGRWNINGQAVGLALIASLLAIVGGLAAALGAVLLVAMLAAVVVGIGLMFSRKFHMAFAMVFALVITGILEFFFFFGQANWLSSILVASMLAVAGFRAIGFSAAAGAPKISAFFVLTASYLLILLASSIINRVPAPQIIVGLRGYVPYIGVAVLLIYGDFDSKFRWLLFKILLAIGLLQIPFSIYEQLVTGPWRMNIRGAIGRADEAIVGTFGGNAAGGGYTGEMASFLVMAMIMALAMRKEALLSKMWTGVLLVALVVPILLAETKIALILIPLLVVVCFGADIKRSPAFAISVLAGGAILCGAIASVYAYKYWNDQGAASQQLGYSFDPTFMVDKDHRGRVGTIVHWYQMNVSQGSPVNALVGHGLASSLEGSLTLGMGTAVRRYGVGLDAHAFSRLLWDGGVLTLSTFMLLTWRTFWLARRLKDKQFWAASDRVGLTFAAGAALSMFLMLPYQMSVLGGSAMQFLFWFVVGYIELMRRKASSVNPIPTVRNS